MTDLIDVKLTDSEFNDFRKLVYETTGISWNDAKRTLVQTRLLKRLRHFNYSTYGEYYNHVVNNDPSGEEMINLINRVTTNKTDFFRENHHFEYLKNELFPELESRSSQRKVRIWSAACSSGEEPYSIAMAALEYFGAGSGWDIRILASDIDSEVLTKAQHGVYQAERVADVEPERLERFFSPVQGDFGTSFQLKDEVRELIAFRRINFMDTAWPITISFDAVFCRNVLIYFDEDTKDTVVTRFADYIKDDSHLFIGHSENITRLTQYFDPLGKTIYRRLKPANRRVKADDQYAAENYAKFNPTIGAAAPPPAKRAPNPRQANVRKAAPTRTPARPVSKGSIATRKPASKQVARPTTQKSKSSADANIRSRLDPNIEVKPIIVGEIEVSATPLCIKTLVGSCIAVCLYDKERGVGGMNHFMLPESSAQIAGCPTMGVHAMELLINQIMCLGGNRLRLEAKVFGGGEVINLNGANHIGKLNTEFIMNFLEAERIPIAAKHVGGEFGRQIAFYTHSGKAFVECLSRTDFTKSQPAVKPKPKPKVIEMDVELF